MGESERIAAQRVLGGDFFARARRVDLLPLGNFFEVCFEYEHIQTNHLYLGAARRV